jgi:hypothetical protein
VRLAITVDLENDLGFRETRLGIDEGMPLILELLERHRVRGTFFVSGACLDSLKESGTLGELTRLGHEIASHGMRHLDYRGWTPEALKGELSRGKELLEEAFQLPVVGYRAPQFLIDPRYLAALKALGFRYDSSFPDPAGIGAARFRQMRAGEELNAALARLELTEFPVPSLPWLKIPHGLLWVNLIGLPLYRRIFPGLSGEPVVFYLHPFDLVRHKERIPLDLKRRVFYLRNGNRAALLFGELLALWREWPVEFVRLADLLPGSKE